MKTDRNNIKTVAPYHFHEQMTKKNIIYNIVRCHSDICFNYRGNYKLIAYLYKTGGAT